MYEEEVDDHAKIEQPLDLFTHRNERARSGRAEGAYADAHAPQYAISLAEKYFGVHRLGTFEKQHRDTQN